MSSDKRQEPRVRVALPVRVRGFSLTTVNLSVSGTQLSCPPMIYSLIGDQLKVPPVELELVLPGGSVAAEAEVLYASGYEDEYLLGVRFVAFPGEGRRQLVDYLVATGGAQFAED